MLMTCIFPIELLKDRVSPVIEIQCTTLECFRPIRIKYSILDSVFKSVYIFTQFDESYIYLVDYGIWLYLNSRPLFRDIHHSSASLQE